MLQRIQTVFLIAVAVAIGSMLLFPIWGKADLETGELHQLSAMYYKHQPAQAEAPIYQYFPYAIVGVLIVAVVVVALIEVTKFNNRLLQMKLGALNSMLMTALLACCMYFAYTGQKEWLPETPGEYQIGMFLPAIAMMCNIIANRFIRKDERLVRSVDRIR